MTEEMKEARFALLKEYGFGDAPICDLMAVFRGPHLALNTNMTIRGDHADDLAYVYYASMEVDGELFDGLFHVPSLLAHLHVLGHKCGWSFEPLLQELNGALGCEARLVFLSGYPAIFTEVYEASWATRDLRFEISDMLKIVGAADYLLCKEYERLLAEEG